MPLKTAHHGSTGSVSGECPQLLRSQCPRQREWCLPMQSAGSTIVMIETATSAKLAVSSMCAVSAKALSLSPSVVRVENQKSRNKQSNGTDQPTSLILQYLKFSCYNLHTLGTSGVEGKACWIPRSCLLELHSKGNFRRISNWVQLWYQTSEITKS